MLFRSYLIQKNASSSIRYEASDQGLRFLTFNEISNLEFVDVYLRSPRSRYLSGVNTFLQHIKRDHPELDYNTAFWFAKKYKFLNRHYMPQWFWLYNLSRFINVNTKIRFRSVEDACKITSYYSDAKIQPYSKDFANLLLKDNGDMEFWFYVDTVLLNLVGSSMTWNNITSMIKQSYPAIANRVLSQT